MTTEPRQEAEEIVDWVYDVASGISGHVNTDADPHDKLVGVLTAAIEHVRANDDVPDDYSVGAWDMDADTFRALRAALSALREDET